jgi:DNA repair exonuclease SbcCD ATPase subunit
MENDKQITDKNLEQVKKIFLSEELLVKNVKPEIYSLPEEFAKSKKNKNYLVYGLIFLYFATIGVGAYFLTAVEDQKSRRVEVNIPEFRQFNFIELLAEKKANEEKLAELQKQLANLRASSMQEIQKLSPKNQQKAIAEMNEKLKKLEDSYKQQISQKEDSLKALQKSISGDEQRIAQNLKETQSQVKKYQDLNQMQGAELVRINTEFEATITKLKADQQAEIERLKKEHQSEIDSLKKENQALVDAIILRYNPVFSKGEIAAAINGKVVNPSNPTLHKYDQALDNTNVLSEQAFNQLRRKIQNQKVILDNLQKIPYTNSMPLALNNLERLSQSIINDYEILWSGLAEQVDSKSSYLGSFDYAMNYLSMTKRESGFVIDARNPNRMLIFIDQAYSLKNGDTAYVFKNDDIPIAKIELTPEHGRVIAKVKEVLRPLKIEPFDKILLKLEVTP